MADPKYNFQYCPKLIVFSEDWASVLLARRQNEVDYDGTWSFIGGKMETGDTSIIEGLRREKDEEIGQSAKIKVYLPAAHNILFRKSDTSSMILPHYLAQCVAGDIRLNPQEYSEYRWVPVEAVATLTPKIENIPEMIAWVLQLKESAARKDFVAI